MSTRIRTMMAALAVAIIGLTTTSAASANVFTAAPKASAFAAGAASIQATDALDCGRCFFDASGTNYTDNTVNITPGQTVDFSFPVNANNSNSHNVVFGVPNGATTPQPTSCVQTVAPPGSGIPILPAPPLPSFSEPPGWAGSCTFNTPGTYVFYCFAHNEMTGTVVVAAAPANTPPTVTATRNPAGNVTTGTSVTFTAVGADTDGDTLTYAWDFGDSGTAATAAATHSYTTAGTYAAKVTVSDGKGGTNSQTLSVIVTQANRNPTVTASRTPSGNVTAGSAVAFSATGVDADSDTLTYSWAFGDATAASTQQNPSHTYTTAGSYVATVTVSDGKGGTGTTTVPVTVTAGSSCPPGTFRDDFNGTSLAPSWSVVRPTGTIAVSNGTVSVPGNAGDIYQTTATATDIVVRTLPSGATTTTAKVNFHGAAAYQQAGIIIYGDDDNYTKLDRGATNSAANAVTEKFEFINEVAGTPRNAAADYTANISQTTFPNDYYLRITSDGTNITGAYSADGTTWTTVGQPAALPANAKVGFYALSNGAATVVNGVFDWLQIDGANVVPDGCGAPANSSPVVSSATGTPTQGIAPLPVSFTAAATDADSDPLTYSWAFGDGGTGTGATATHTYATSGTFNAVVTVSDGKGGTATKTVPITVAPADDPSARYRVLVFSKTAAFAHDSIPNGIAAIQLLGTQKNFQVDSTKDAGWFRADILAHYKAVIWLETTGDVLTDTQQTAFENYIKAGGGYAGIHSAADTEYGWPWYGKLVGAYFKDHPNGTPSGTVIREDSTDASTASLPATWPRVDEWYNYQTFTSPVDGGGAAAIAFNPRNNPDLHILLTTDTTSYTGAVPAGTDHPIAWCHKYDGGRSWYTGLGHTQASYTDASFLAHIYGGIQDAAGAVPSVCGAAAPNQVPTVTSSRTPTGTVTAGTAVAFTATGTDADNDTLTYSWNFGDGTAASTQQNPSHTYATAGTYSAVVTVSDGKGGTGTSTQSVTVQAVAGNLPPTITTGSATPASGLPPLAVAFTVAATDPDSDTLTYAWDFGDGTAASTQQNPSHTYTTTGSYTAKVTVSDGKGGTVSRTFPIAVSTGSVTTPGDVGGDVPFVLGLTLNGPATLGPLLPGVTKDYVSAITATVTSTAGDAALSVADPDTVQTGKLVNGSYALASPLQVMATNTAHPTGAFAPVGGSANPVSLLTWSRATSRDAVSIAFKQSIASTETLRAGNYTKTLTFTLSTVTP